MTSHPDDDAIGSLPQDLAGLYDAYGRAAYRQALRRVRDRELAADVVQEAFLSLWRGRHHYQPERGAVGGLLCTLVNRRAVELLRRRASWPQTEPLDHVLAQTLVVDAPGPAEQACSSDQARRTLHAIDKLPAAKGQALRLAWLGGYRASEIAALLGVPHGTVKTRILTGRAQLRVLLPRESLD